MADKKNEKFLEYKGKPLVRCDKTIYYGNMSDPYVICLNVLDEKNLEDLKMSGRVVIQLINTDPDVSPKDKIVKKSEKSGLFNALDLGAVWLERALK
ncbi:MAG: hypothetical protein K2H13_07815 [Eubacterium sp.]|nr:hypothetical protein [Eubacterium sp.]MDE6470576.1 hypothetical protein [Eubacterium sp.]